MADNTEMQRKYAREMTANYETGQSLLRHLVNVEGSVNGNEFEFIIEGIAEMASKRGASGSIPFMPDGQSNSVCVLDEYHHKMRKNKFNIESSSVDQRKPMQNQGVRGINKRTDQLIIAQMMTTTYTSLGAAAAGSLGWAMEGLDTLYDNEVGEEDDGKICCMLTSRAWLQMMRVKEFASADYVKDAPFMNASTKSLQMKDWMGVKWFMNKRAAGKGGLTGKGTNDAKCIMWHYEAVGHALNLGDLQTAVGYNDEDDYSFARATSYQGSKMLIPEGCVIMPHDDTAALS